LFRIQYHFLEILTDYGLSYNVICLMNLKFLTAGRSASRCRKKVATAKFHRLILNNAAGGFWLTAGANKLSLLAKNISHQRLSVCLRRKAKDGSGG